MVQILELITVIFGITGQIILSRKQPDLKIVNSLFLISNICAIVHFTLNPSIFIILYFVYTTLSIIGIINNKKEGSEIFDSISKK
jgi:hypothetical protein